MVRFIFRKCWFPAMKTIKTLWINIRIAKKKSTFVGTFATHTHHIIYIYLYMVPMWAGIAQSEQQFAAGWTVRESNLGGDEIFRTRPDPGAHPASYAMGTGTFPGVKRPGSSSVEVKGRVALYLYSPSRPSWPFVGCTLPLWYQYSQQCLKIVLCQNLNLFNRRISAKRKAQGPYILLGKVLQLAQKIVCYLSWRSITMWKTTLYGTVSRAR